MSSLQELQLRVQQAVMASSPAAPPELAGDAIAGARERLAIYRHGYRARLREALAAEFPGFRCLAGRRFAGALDRYIDACPSEHYNIRWHGAGLAAFLGYALPWCERRVNADVARLDWAISICFDAADEPTVDIDELARIPPEQWATLRLRLPQHAQLLVLESNAHDFRRAADRGLRRPRPRRYPDARPLIVWREATTVHYRLIAPDEHPLLIAAAHGEPFAALCERAAERPRQEQAAPRLASWMRDWVESGLVREVLVETKT